MRQSENVNIKWKVSQILYFVIIIIIMYVVFKDSSHFALRNSDIDNIKYSKFDQNPCRRWGL